VIEKKKEKEKTSNITTTNNQDKDKDNITTTHKEGQEVQEGQEEQNKKHTIPEKGIFFINSDEELTKWLVDYYGIVPTFPTEQLVTHSKINKRIYFVSKGVINLLTSDKRNQLKLVSAGVKLFSSIKIRNELDTTFCKYRICQDALLYLLPFMTKRLMFVDTDFFVKLLKENDVKIPELEDKELLSILDNMLTGYVAVINVKNKPENHDVTKLNYDDYIKYLRANYIDVVACYKSKMRLSIQINKDHKHVFNLKYNLEQ
jgi:hypothetical protein